MPLRIPARCFLKAFTNESHAVVDDVVFVAKRVIALAVHGRVLIYNFTNPHTPEFYLSAGIDEGENRINKLDSSHCCDDSNDHNWCTQQHVTLIAYTGLPRYTPPGSMPAWRAWWDERIDKYNELLISDPIEAAGMFENEADTNGPDESNVFKNVSFYISTDERLVFHRMMLSVPDGRIYGMTLLGERIAILIKYVPGNISSECQLFGINQECLIKTRNTCEFQKMHASQTSGGTSQNLVVFVYLHLHVDAYNHDDHDETNSTIGSVDLHFACAFPFSAHYNGLIGFTLMEDQSGALLIWNDAKIYYSPNYGHSVFDLELYMREPLLDLEAVKKQYIVHAATNSKGQFVLTTSRFSQDRNVIFGHGGVLGISAEATVLKIAEHMMKDEGNNQFLSLLLFDRRDRLMLLRIEELAGSGLRAQLIEVDVLSLIRERFPMLPACSCMAFSGFPSGITKYLDRNKELLVEVQIVPAQWKTCELMVTVSNKSIMASTEVLKEEVLEKGITKRTICITLTENHDDGHNSRISHETSHVLVSTYPQSMSCATNQQLILHVNTGCPPTKHIRLRGKPDITDCLWFYDSHKFSIPSLYYDADMDSREEDTNGVIENLQYELDKWGCPIQIHFSDPWKPTLELWDGDKYLGVLNADYVLYEIHGRKFGYGSTIEEICGENFTGRAQSWRSMLQVQMKKENRRHVPTAWTRENYCRCLRHCPDDDDIVESSYKPSPEEPYQVLNSDTSNQLRFVKSNGILVFEVIVVDPDCSYCDLRTQFALDIYGVGAMNTLPSALPVAIIVLTFFFLFLVAYCIKLVINRREKERSKDAMRVRHYKERAYDESRRPSLWTEHSGDEVTEERLLLTPRPARNMLTPEDAYYIHEQNLQQSD